MRFFTVKEYSIVSKPLREAFSPSDLTLFVTSVTIYLWFYARFTTFPMDIKGVSLMLQRFSRPLRRFLDLLIPIAIVLLILFLIARS